jgi:uncharacterized protein
VDNRPRSPLTLESVFLTPSGQLRTWWRIVVFLLATFAASMLVTPLLSSFAPGSVASLLGETWRVLGALAATWMVTHRIERRGWGIVGLARQAWDWRVAAGGFALGALAIGVAVAVLVATPLAEFAPDSSRAWAGDLIRSVLILAPAALTEELYLRGYPFSALRDGLGWPAATAITSVAFGLLHLGNPGVTVQAIALVTAAGVFLAIIRVVTGSLVAAWMAHFAWNWTLAMGWHAPVSGLPFGTPGYRLIETGPDWLTGGVWGPEAGAVSALGMGVALAALAKFTTTARVDAGREDTPA